ncbi:MAG: hypothetical protein HKN83_09145 [Gammaproteobacteria bacterium]|nr:hypothetical protein [Gammaproteobacteria bacterium]
MKRVIHRNLSTLVTVLTVLCTALPSYAEEIIRDRSLIMTMPIEGVTLSMTPKQAFEHLVASGFSAENIDRFEDWTTPGISFRKEGAMKPSGYPKWYIEIALGQEDGRLIHVSETSQKLDRTNYDLATEINHVRSHFGIAEDEPECSYSERGGICSVIDTKNANNVVYAFQVKPTTKSTQLIINSK